MKLPVVWIVAAFASGICAATFYPTPARMGGVIPAGPILLGGIFLWRNFLRSAGIAALLAWAALGAATPAVERAIVPSNHVTRLIAVRRL